MNEIVNMFLLAGDKFMSKTAWKSGSETQNTTPYKKSSFTKTLKYWVGVHWGQSYLMGRCLFSFAWPPF